MIQFLIHFPQLVLEIHTISIAAKASYNFVSN